MPRATAGTAGITFAAGTTAGFASDLKVELHSDRARLRSANGHRRARHTTEAEIAKIRRAVVQTIGTVKICETLAGQLMEPSGHIPAGFRSRIDGKIACGMPAIETATTKVDQWPITASGW